MTHKDFLIMKNGEFSKLIDVVISEPKLESLSKFLNSEISDDDGERQEFVRSLETLWSLTKNRRHIPHPALRKVIKTLFGTINRGLQFFLISKIDLPRRPKEEGLVQSLRDFAAAMREYRDYLLAVPFDPTEADTLAEEIETDRELAALAIEVVENAVSNLAVKESRAAELMRRNYRFVRELVQAHSGMRGAFASVEAYLFGSAQKAIDTRRDNERQEERLTEKAEKRGAAAAADKARKSLTDQLEGMLDMFRRTKYEENQQETAPEQRVTSRT